MPLVSLDRQAPPMFKQGASATTKLVLYAMLAIFLMVADKRFEASALLRSGLVTLMTPVQVVALAPVRAAQAVGQYFEDLAAARQALADSQNQLLRSAIAANQVAQLTAENLQLRQLLSLNAKLGVNASAAEVLYDSPDPFSRKIILDKGALAGIVSGSPVVAAQGVIGQVTRVHPSVSEVTLITDRDHPTPVLNLRTGARSIAYGLPRSDQTDVIELRFMATNADVEVGDVLNTSGIDGVYPGGLAVAKVVKVERQADSAFARIYCTPMANPVGVQQVLVIKPQLENMPARPQPETHAASTGKKRIKP